MEVRICKINITNSLTVWDFNRNEKKYFITRDEKFLVIDNLHTAVKSIINNNYKVVLTLNGTIGAIAPCLIKGCSVSV